MSIVDSRARLAVPEHGADEDGLRAADSTPSSRYGIDVNTLQTINEFNEGDSNFERLVELGGVKGLARMLCTDLENGLSRAELESEFEDRRRHFGRNVMPKPPPKTFLQLWLAAFQDTMLLVLLVCSVVSLGIGLHEHPSTGWIEGTAILIAVNLVSTVTAINDYTKEKQFRKLNDVSDDIKVKVIREGEQVQVSTLELNVGEVVVLETGDKVPADAIFLEGTDLELNESSLTGEPKGIRKDAAHPFLLSGTYVSSGRAHALIIAVGPQSQWGRIKAALNKEQGPTPLQQKLDDMAKLIGYIGTTAAVLTFTAQFIIWWVDCPTTCSGAMPVMCPDRSCVVNATACPACPLTGRESEFLCYDRGALAYSATECHAVLADCTVRTSDDLTPCQPENVTLASYLVDAFIIAVTVVVVAIPEGLPLAVTISLSYSTRQMLKDQNLIRHLAACETMGNATNICSDKTGTLTQNFMTVVAGWIAGTYHEQDHLPPASQLPPAALDAVVEGLSVNSTAVLAPKAVSDDILAARKKSGRKAHAHGVGAGSLELTEVKTDEDDGGAGAGAGAGVKRQGSALEMKYSKDMRFDVQGGNGTEGALLKLVLELGGNYKKIRKQFNSEEAMPRQYMFESKRKMMSTLVRKPDGSGFRLHVKGASEIVLEKSTHALTAQGTAEPLGDALRDELESKILSMAQHALRTIGIAYRDFPADGLPEDLDTPPEEQLTLVAIVGIIDPLRPDVKDAVRLCQHAGIMVRMVTGDNIHTATAIARQCGILTAGGEAIEGPKFRKLTPRQLDELLPTLQVLARSSPDDKDLLVTRLNGTTLPRTREEWEGKMKTRMPEATWEEHREQLLPGFYDEWLAARQSSDGVLGQEVVGATGDGTNDGPALRAADVGLSMGESGTEVAKEASDIVILDDKFSSIVQAVKWGRSVYDNIRKFLQFQLTVNVAALAITFIGAVSGFEPPLNAVMMLWVNLIMDTLGALALATEPPTDHLMDRPPYKRTAALVSRPMWRNILVQSGFQLTLLLILLYEGKSLFNLERSGRESCIEYDTADTNVCTKYDHTHYTIIFNAFVFCQLFNEFNSRRIGSELNCFENLHKSAAFMAVIFITILLQIFIVEVGGEFTRTAGLSFGQWMVTIALGAISLPLGFLQRFIPIHEDPREFAGYNMEGTRGQVMAATPTPDDAKHGAHVQA